MSSTSQIKYGAIISYIAIGINIVTGLLYTPWMIHSIGKGNFGLYTLAMSVISLFVFDFGLSSAVTRFVAKYLAEGKPEQANNCLGLVYKLYIYIDIILILVLSIVYFFIPSIYQELTPDEIEKFKIVYIIAAVFSIISFPFIPVNGILTAHEKFIQLKGCDLFHKLFIVITMTCCLLMGYGLYALVSVNAIAGLVVIALKLWIIRRDTTTHINFKYKNSSELREILGYSGWTTLIAVSQRFIFNIAPSILGIMSGSESIAILGIAITLEGYTFTFANAINGLFLPKVSRIISHDDRGILPLMIRVGRIQILIIGLLVIGFITLGHEFIHLWVGQAFEETYLCAILLILPSFFHLPQEIAATTIIATNKVKLQAYVFMFMALLNIILAFSLAHLYGALGIAISICIAYIVRTIGMDIIYYKKLNIDILAFFKASFGQLALPLFETFIIGLIISIYLPVNGWIGFILKGGLLVSIYSIIMIYQGMNTEEKSLIRSLIPKLNRNE